MPDVWAAEEPAARPCLDWFWLFTGTPSVQAPGFLPWFQDIGGSRLPGALPWTAMESEPRSTPSPTPTPSPTTGGHHASSPERAERNREAIDYYRDRSRAPGVESGGEARNFYCMACDGVIPHEHEGAGCPHCGAAIDERVRRYFNWVEIDRPVEGDFRALLPWLVALAALLGGLGWWFATWIVDR